MINRVVTFYCIVCSAIVTLACVLAGCPQTTPVNGPPDATDAFVPSPIVDAAAVDAVVTAVCDAGPYCCTLCSHLSALHCALPSCATACAAAVKHKVIDLTCLAAASTVAAVHACDVNIVCSP